MNGDPGSAVKAGKIAGRTTHSISKKKLVRGLLRRVGYNIVRFSDDFSDQQVRFLEQASIDLLLDVGANEGQYGQRMRALGYHGEIVSYEPGSVAFSRLRAAIRNDDRWSAHRLAVGATSGSITLNVSANSVSSSILAVGREHLAAAPESATVSAETVQMEPLDALLPPGGARSAWLKIDVQGAEQQVLDGAKDVLGSRIAVLQLELSLRELYDGQVLYQELLGKLARLGFGLAAIEPGFQDPKTGRLLQFDGLLLHESLAA